MRLSSILVATAAALLVCCDAISTATERTLSTMASPHAVQSVDAAPVKSARFLRSTKAEVDSDDLQELEEEERMNSSMLTPIEDLLTKLKINEAVALQNLPKHDAELFKKLQQNPTLASKIEAWKRMTSARWTWRNN